MLALRIVDVRLNPSLHSEYASSISRIDVEGNVRWTTEPPNGPRNDSWITANLENANVIGYSWSRFPVVIDAQNGSITSGEFVK